MNHADLNNDEETEIIYLIINFLDGIVTTMNTFRVNLIGELVMRVQNVKNDQYLDNGDNLCLLSRGVTLKIRSIMKFYQS